MKKAIFSLVLLVMSFMAVASSRRVALVVQNHTSSDLNQSLSAVADTLTACLSGRDIHIINVSNQIGVKQNREVKGEEMPETSAKELGRIVGAEGVLTASVQEYTKEGIGVPPVAYVLKMRIALSLMDCASGETVCGISGPLYSKNYTVEKMKADGATFFEEHLLAAAENSAKLFLGQYDKSSWKVGKQPAAVKVFFGCNVLGADVQIDGLSYGTCPAELELPPGVHNVLVSYPPFYHAFRRRAMFNANGQTFAVVLQLNPEGEAQRLRALDYEAKLYGLTNAKRDVNFDYETRKNKLKREQAEHCELFKKQMQLADAMLMRYRLSGEADDYVRKTIADGTSLYWKNSFGRIVITDGSAENIEFTTPSTDAADIAVPPSPKVISEGLQNLLMKMGAKH